MLAFLSSASSLIQNNHHTTQDTPPNQCQVHEKQNALAHETVKRPPKSFQTNVRESSELTTTLPSKYLQNAQNRPSENTSPASSGYGISKRTLGGRRGPNSRFVPPIAGRDDSTGHSNTNKDYMEPVSTGTHGTGWAASTANAKSNSTVCADDRLKQFDSKIVDMIMSEIMDCKSIIAWDDIAGLEYQKKSLQEVVILPMLRPDLFTGLRGPPKGLLLFGPPGTGKTLIGEGEKMVRALFTIARLHQPSVIFIDEVDSLLTQRSESEHESSRRIKTEFLVQLDGVSTTGDERLLFVGATNRPKELDEAARRRFVKRLYIPLPTLEARKQIVHRLLQPHLNTLQADDLDVIGDRSDGFSGSDMASLCREAAMGPIRSLSMETLQSIACDEVRPVALADFMAAFNHVRPSVSTGDLEQYHVWNRQYGSFNATESRPTS